MTQPVYFGIVMQHGLERPQKYFDEVPRPLREKDAPLAYCCRLDTLPGGEAFAALPAEALLWVYHGWKARGRLPPDTRG